MQAPIRESDERRRPDDNRRHAAKAAHCDQNAPAAANNAKPNPWYPDHAVFNADKDQLKGMPEFKYSTE